MSVRLFSPVIEADGIKYGAVTVIFDFNFIDDSDIEGLCYCDKILEHRNGGPMEVSGECEAEFVGDVLSYCELKSELGSHDAGGTTFLNRISRVGC